MPGAVANVAQVHRSLELESQPNNRNMRAPRIRGLHLFSPARVEMGTAHLPKVKQASALRSRPERGANLDRRCALCHVCRVMSQQESGCSKTYKIWEAISKAGRVVARVNREHEFGLFGESVVRSVYGSAMFL